MYIRLRSGFVPYLFFLLATPALHAQQVYTVEASGRTQALRFGPCAGAECRWTDIDNNPRTAVLAGGANALFQLHDNGAIWMWQGEPCLDGGCPSWILLDQNPRAQAIAAGSGELFQLHRDGSIWRWLGQPCGPGGCRSWERLDNNPAAEKIVTAGGHLYQLHGNGGIWEWMGEPCAGNACRSWRQLDHNPRTSDLVARGDDLFQLHDSGSIWRWLGRPCDEGGCRSWQRLDANARTTNVVAARGGLFQLHRGGAIWEWTGEPCVGDACRGWRPLDFNASTVDISAAGDALYQIHGSGAVWHWRGEPCGAAGCRSWERVNSEATPGSSLYAFDGTGVAAAPIQGYARWAPSIETRRARVEPFGFGTREELGPRPLLTVLHNWVGPTGVPRYALPLVSRYDAALYSTEPGDLSIANYFSDVSKGKLRIVKAGLVPITDRGATPNREAVLRLASAYVDFARYDANGDGTVTTDELAVLVIDNLSEGNGTRAWECLTTDGVRVCLSVALAGGKSSLDNFAHEIAHLFEVGDLYGSNCWHQDRALMGHCSAANAVTTPLLERSVEFGAWNRMRFGWLLPNLLSASAPGTCTTLSAASLRSVEDQALLLYDPARGSKEYFLLEHRTKVTGPAYHPHDAWFPGSGLTPVYVSVKTDPEGDLRAYTDSNGNDVEDKLVYMSNDPASLQRLDAPLPADGSSAELTWFDGSPTGVSARARYPDQGSGPQSGLHVEIQGGVPFPPALLGRAITGPLSVGLRRGRAQTLPRGVFGIDENGRRLELRDRSGLTVPLTATTWSCNEVEVSVPADVPLGEYDLVATHPEWLSSHPLNVRVRIVDR